MIGALILGGFAGIVIGILAMAISILMINFAQLINNQVMAEFAGVRMTAVTFVTFDVLGWVAATFTVWHRLKERN